MLSLPDAELHVEVVEEPGEDPKMVKISDVELGDVVRCRQNIVDSPPRGILRR